MKHSFAATANEVTPPSLGQQMLNKVPEVTIFFWIIKVLCTTVGETASDFLNVNLGFGLTNTSIVMGLVLLVVLFAQFKARRYIPGIYWVTVVLISIFGTLVTDNLTDSIGIPLEVSTIVFSVALGLTFVVWYVSEKTLSIHSIFTSRREAFYWLAILFTFALGTATGDLMAEGLGLGYVLTGVIVGVVIASVAFAWRFGLDPILAFWMAYIMTRPLGASLGDYLSQSPTYGGLGLGATVTSALFLGAILLTIIFLSVTQRDVSTRQSTQPAIETRPAAVFRQVAIVVSVLALVAGGGYYWRHAQLQEQAKTAVTPTSPLGDVSSFTTIEEDTLRLVNAGDLAGAKTRVDDLERTWDDAQARLKPMDTARWTAIDGTIDTVLRQLRAAQQDPAACKAALEVSLAAFNGGSTIPASALSKMTTVPRAGAPLPRLTRPTMLPTADAPAIAPSQPTRGAISAPIPTTVTPTTPLGDLSSFKSIEEDTLRLVNAGDLAGAKARVDNLETAWDDAQARLKPLDTAKWTEIDGTIDTVLRQLRAAQQDPAACKAALEAALATLK